MTALDAWAGEWAARTREAAILAVVDLPGELTVREGRDVLTDQVGVRVTQRFASGRQVRAMAALPRDPNPFRNLNASS